MKGAILFWIAVVVLAILSSIIAGHLAAPAMIDPKGKMEGAYKTPSEDHELGPMGLAFNPDHHHVYGTYSKSGRIAAQLIGNTEISLHNEVTSVSKHCRTPRALVHDRERYHFFFTCAEEHHGDHFENAIDGGNQEEKTAKKGEKSKASGGESGDDHQNEHRHNRRDEHGVGGKDASFRKGKVDTFDPDNDGIYQVTLPRMKISTAVPKGLIRHPGYITVDHGNEIIVSEISENRGFRELAREILAPSSTGRVLALRPLGDAGIDENGEFPFRIIADKLNAPLGVEITHDESSVLVASAADWTITKFPIGDDGTNNDVNSIRNGNGQGNAGSIIVRLPGVPYAIKRRVWKRDDGRGSYWVAIHSIPEWFWPGYLVPNIGPLRSIVANLLPLSWLKTALGGWSAVLEIDDDGNVLSTHQDPSGEISHITDVADSHVWLHIASELGHGVFHHKLVRGYNTFQKGSKPSKGVHLHDDL